MTTGLPSIEAYRYHAEHPEDVRAFLANVFQLVDVDIYVRIFQQAVRNNETSADVYNELLSRAGEAKSGCFAQLQALRNERDSLAANVEKVMDPLRPKEGYVEIGLPGRMIKALTPKMGLHGRVSVVNETSSLLQSGFPRPYDAFHTLDYNPLPLNPKSVEVISCFAGLHHCPLDKLENFVESIHETLHDGGILLLREHDTSTSELLQLAGVIHSLFNAATGVPLAEERAEVRAFRSVEEWGGLLELKGFLLVERDEHLLREGDSTQNALLKFVKISKTTLQLDCVREKLITDRQGIYTRPLEQTYMTLVEWFNVESAQNLGDYDNFWDYPYFRDVAYLWKNFYVSVRTASRATDLTTVLKNSWFTDSLVLTTLMTVQYIVQGIFAFPLWVVAQFTRILPGGANDLNWNEPAQYYSTVLWQHGSDLEVTPFYAQEYAKHIGVYWDRFSEAWSRSREERWLCDMIFDRQTVKNIVMGFALTIDMVARASIATPINWAMGGEVGGDQRDIGLITKDTDDFYEGITSDRYKELEKKLGALINEGKEIIEIAGQTEIRIEILAEDEQADYPGELLYERAYLPDTNQKLVSLKIKMEDLPLFFGRDRQYDVHRLYDY